MYKVTFFDFYLFFFMTTFTTFSLLNCYFLNV